MKEENFTLQRFTKELQLLKLQNHWKKNKYSSSWKKVTTNIFQKLAQFFKNMNFASIFFRFVTEAASFLTFAAYLQQLTMKTKANPSKILEKRYMFAINFFFSDKCYKLPLIQESVEMTLFMWKILPLYKKDSNRMR